MATGQAVHGAAGKVANFGIIAAFAAFAAFPFAWMLITTFKQTGDLLDPGHNPFLYHQPPTLDNLRILFNDTLFVRWAGNTIFIGVLVVLITLAMNVHKKLAQLTKKRLRGQLIVNEDFVSTSRSHFSSDDDFCRIPLQVICDTCGRERHFQITT